MPRKTRLPSDPFKALKGSLVSTAEQDEFLSAVDRFDPGKKDSMPAEPARPQAQPRRLKQLERGNLKPVATLDLHGLLREEALARTRSFLNHAARQGWPAVVIVTGKGLHSPAGPVLRQAVEQLLTAVPHLVLEWAQAPRPYGGAGALVVFPRHQSQA